MGAAPKWVLVARNAFSGVLLWKRPMGLWDDHLRPFRSGPADLARRLVALKDRLYVTLGYGQPVTALDAATGAVVRTYSGSGNAFEILVAEGALFVVAGEPNRQGCAGEVVVKSDTWSFWQTDKTGSCKKRILAFSADTAKLLWQKADADAADVMATTLAVSQGRLFFQNTRELIALEAGSGKELWRAARPVMKYLPWGWAAPTLVVYDGVVLSGGKQTQPKAKASDTKGNANPPEEMIAFSATTGKKLWSAPCYDGFNSPPDILIIDGLVWAGNTYNPSAPGFTEMRDVRTGEVRKTRPGDASLFKGQTHDHRYANGAHVGLGSASYHLFALDKQARPFSSRVPTTWRIWKPPRPARPRRRRPCGPWRRPTAGNSASGNWIRLLCSTAWPPPRDGFTLPSATARCSAWAADMPRLQSKHRIQLS